MSDSKEKDIKLLLLLTKLTQMWTKHGSEAMDLNLVFFMHRRHSTRAHSGTSGIRKLRVLTCGKDVAVFACKLKYKIWRWAIGLAFPF
jgi:hypothetical protein